MEALIAIKDEVMNKVGRERIPPTVQIWLTRVEAVHSRSRHLNWKAWSQLENMCLCGLCSKNVCSSYKYGKSVFLFLEEVKKIKLKDDFKEVAELPRGPEVVERGILGVRLGRRKCSRRHRSDLWKMKSESWVCTVWVVYGKLTFSKKS